MNMIRGEHMRGAAGLLFLQPYDPEKVPVIFVHGLLSAPSAWANVASSLSADPEIRRHFQFWAFSYSTGNPIAYSALLLRQDLEYAEETYHFRRAILVGHSMGGIIFRLQVTNSERTLVPTGHGAMEHPKSVGEIRRILLEQIDTVKAKGMQEKVPEYGTTLLPAA